MAGNDVSVTSAIARVPPPEDAGAAASGRTTTDTSRPGATPTELNPSSSAAPHEQPMAMLQTPRLPCEACTRWQDAARTIIRLRANLNNGNSLHNGRWASDPKQLEATAANATCTQSSDPLDMRTQGLHRWIDAQRSENVCEGGACEKHAAVDPEEEAREEEKEEEKEEEEKEEEDKKAEAVGEPAVALGRQGAGGEGAGRQPTRQQLAEPHAGGEMPGQLDVQQQAVPRSPPGAPAASKGPAAGRGAQTARAKEPGSDWQSTSDSDCDCCDDGGGGGGGLGWRCRTPSASPGFNLTAAAAASSDDDDDDDDGDDHDDDDGPGGNGASVVANGVRQVSIPMMHYAAGARRIIVASGGLPPPPPAPQQVDPLECQVAAAVWRLRLAAAAAVGPDMWLACVGRLEDEARDRRLAAQLRPRPDPAGVALRAAWEWYYWLLLLGAACLVLAGRSGVQGWCEDMLRAWLAEVGEMPY